MFEIEFTRKALSDLAWFKKNAQQEILDGIEAALRHEPNLEAQNRKRLRPNATAEWELRLGRFRVFYDVNVAAKIVSVEAIGLKMRNIVRFQGEEAEL